MKGRTQTVTRRARRVTSGRRRGGLVSLRRVIDLVVRFAKPLLLLVSIIASIIGYNQITESKAFALKSIEVYGATSDVEAAIKQTIQQTVGVSRLLDVSLEGIRDKVQSIPRVRSATVMRKLPDAIRVEISERQPVLPVRRGQSVVWLDQDAVNIGDVSSIKLPGGIPPVATGFSDGPPSQASQADDKERIALYKQIEQEFSKEPNPIWNLVDEVDLSFVKDVNIRLIRPPVLIRLGSRDFRARTETALKVLQAVKQGDATMLSRLGVPDPDWVVRNTDRVQAIDALRPDRVVLSFSTSRQDSQARRAPGTNR